MLAAPIPSDDATAIDAAETVRLGPAERGTVSFEPERSGTRFHLTTVAVSKREGAAYRILMDDEEEWNAAIPPTDVDDLQATFVPTKTFRTRMTVVVEDLRASGSKRDYHIQPVGWEQESNA
jgi:hypothetical protein